jgi:hypothetical protein
MCVRQRHCTCCRHLARAHGQMRHNPIRSQTLSQGQQSAYRSSSIRSSARVKPASVRNYGSVTYITQKCYSMVRTYGIFASFFEELRCSGIIDFRSKWNIKISDINYLSEKNLDFPPILSRMHPPKRGLAIKSLIYIQLEEIIRRDAAPRISLLVVLTGELPIVAIFSTIQGLAQRSRFMIIAIQPTGPIQERTAAARQKEALEPHDQDRTLLGRPHFASFALVRSRQRLSGPA